MTSSSSHTSSGQRPRVLVIGGGFGGLSAASALADAPVDVTVVDRANHHLFQPMLYQLATGIVSEGEIAAPLRGVFASQSNARTRLAEVEAIDLDARTVSARAPDGQPLTLPCDYLIVAAGAHPAYFGNDRGVWGPERGYCLMIGGDEDTFTRVKPIFASVAPGVGDTPRTPGREGEVADSENGFLYCGPSGAGHFVKMVHNGIEYGIMGAYAEGLNILSKANIGDTKRDDDAETAPLEDPQFYKYDLDLPEVAEVWRRGSVIASWLLDLTAQALHESPTLEGYSGRVSDSGEGRWTAQAAIEEGVPAPVLTAALFDRFSSRGLDHFADQLLSAMRHGFGGHDEKPADQ